MGKNTASWVRGRGLSRLLAKETNVSDLIQMLSDLDPSPWLNLVGFVPDKVVREASTANQADLLLVSDSQTAVVEVKLGHLMSTDQQARYESLQPQPDLYLSALNSDHVRVEDSAERWRFLDLTEVVDSWSQSGDHLAQLLAGKAAGILASWDSRITGVFSDRTSDSWAPMTVLDQKFLARVVTRRIAHDLRMRIAASYAGVTSGGGLALVQGWTPIRDESNDRSFIAEIRWQQQRSTGVLRFGVDFDPRPGSREDEEVRRAAYELARSMTADIEFEPLHDHLRTTCPHLAALLRRNGLSRPKAKGDWERVITHGFAGAPLADGSKNNRTRTTPDFFGDRALRFEAIAAVDFAQASALDLSDLIEEVLAFLTARQP